jgi:hypothetical protein
MAEPGYRLKPTTIGRLSETKTHDKNIPTLVASSVLVRDEQSSDAFTYDKDNLQSRSRDDGEMGGEPRTICRRCERTRPVIA